MKKKLIAADFASIEARVLAALAGETWLLDAYRAFDKGRGPDLYRLAYARAFGLDVEKVTKDQRQIGKIMVLALGFGGGPGAFSKMATGYGVDIGESFDLLSNYHEELAKAEAGWASRGHKSDMSERTWIAAEIVKILWRKAHPNIVQFWWDLQSAAMQSLDTQATINCGPIKFRRAGSCVYMRLPSGRALAYAYPIGVMREMPWDGDDGKPDVRRVFGYRGVNSYSRKWDDCYATAGLFCENATQAVARDILAEAMFRVEDAGYPIVLTVHDEIVCEVPAPHGSVDAFCKLISAPVPWLPECPIAAEGWEGERYRK